MSYEDTVREFFRCFGLRDLDGVRRLLAEDAHFDFPKTPPMRDRERILRFLRVLFRQYPALTFEIQRVIMQGPEAAVHWKNRGMNRNNEPYDNEGVTILEMEGMTIRYISDFFKDTEKF